MADIELFCTGVWSTKHSYHRFALMLQADLFLDLGHQLHMMRMHWMIQTITTLAWKARMKEDVMVSDIV
jgi:hypothetical protein